MRVLIIDDEPLAIDRLRRRLADEPGVDVVGTASTGLGALEACAELTPDLVLLDIQMPGGSGIEVARALRLKPSPEVVFITAFANYAPEAFELDAADYLLKPVRADRLSEALRRARRRLALRTGASAPVTPRPPPPTTDGYSQELWVPERDGYLRIRTDQIRRIEANRDYALIYTPLRSHLLRTTMAELERRLDPQQIARVHRSAFVRLDTVARVERVGRSLLRLHTDDGVCVEVGVSYARRVLQQLGVADLAAPAPEA